MVFTSQLILPLTSVLILMLIGQGILLIIALLLVFVSFWETLISWRSTKQHIVSRSSTEAEYRAMADTSSELLTLHWLLKDMGLTYSSSTVLHCNNRSAIQVAHNDVFHERTKHIEIDCYLVRHHLSARILSLFPVSSSD
jgi:hypothetical protein